MKTKTFAERELDILVKTVKAPIVKDFIPEIISLVEKFGNSGQSGGSAPYTAKALSQTIEKLCLQMPICPITGINEEWTDLVYMGDKGNFQNNRCSALFKDENSRVTYVDAIVKRTESGSCWSGSFWLSKEDYLTGNRDLMIRGTQEIKGFPFEPKTFYIDVIEEEVAPDDWEMYLKDHKQLDDVWEYYLNPNLEQ